MKKKTGQSLQEYAIVLALLAVLSIAGLSLLGKSTSNLLAKSADTHAVNELYSIIDASVDPAGAQKGLSGSHGNDPAADGKLVLTIDPKTGEVSINGIPRSDATATGTDGTALKALADKIGLLADSPLASGNPQVGDLLAQLHASAKSIAEFQAYYSDNKDRISQLNAAIADKAASGQQGGPPFYDASLVSATVKYTDQYVTFSKTYQQLNGMLANMAPNSPEAAALQQQITDFASGVTQIAHGNVGTPLFSGFNMNFANLSDVMTAMKDAPAVSPIFTQLATKSLLMSPAQKEVFFREQILGLGEKLAIQPDNLDANQSYTITLNPESPNTNPGATTATAQ